MSNDTKKESVISPLGLAIWFLAALFFLYEFFLRTFIGSVAHQIIPDLKLNAETFSILGSAYYIAYGIMQVPVGILVDKFGVKKIMIFATLVCAGATYLFTHSTDFTSALISRLLMGFGSSFAFVSLLVVVVNWFPQRFFAFFAGTSQFIGTLGPLLAGGPLITLMADSHATWREALRDIGFFGIVLAIGILLIVKNKPRGKKNKLIMLKIREPFKTKLSKLIKNKQVWYIALYSSSVYVSIALLGAIWGTDYLQTRGLSQDAAADVISLAWLGYGVSCPILGALSDIAKRRKPAQMFCAIIGLLATCGITYLPLHGTVFIYSILFFGLGIAASGQNLGFASISEHVTTDIRAAAIGLNNAGILLFGAFIPPLASYFITIPTNFLVGFSFMPILNFIALMTVSFFIKETYCKPQKEAIRLYLN